MGADLAEPYASNAGIDITLMNYSCPFFSGFWGFKLLKGVAQSLLETLASIAFGICSLSKQIFEPSYD